MAAGAVVSGSKPIATPSLSDDDAQFRAIADELWGADPGSGEHRTGKGTVYGNGSLGRRALPSRRHARLRVHEAKQDTNLLSVHRVLADGDLYYVNNRNDRAETVDATFRVSGKEAELWHADTGKREPASFRIANGRTTVPLNLEPWGTVFVVFRKSAAALRTDAAEARRGGDRGRRGIVGRELPGEPWRSGDDHHRHAGFLE